LSRSFSIPIPFICSPVTPAIQMTVTYIPGRNFYRLLVVLPSLNESIGLNEGDEAKLDGGRRRGWSRYCTGTVGH